MPVALTVASEISIFPPASIACESTPLTLRVPLPEIVTAAEVSMPLDPVTLLTPSSWMVIAELPLYSMPLDSSAIIVASLSVSVVPSHLML